MPDAFITYAADLPSSEELRATHAALREVTTPRRRPRPPTQLRVVDTPVPPPPRAPGRRSARMTLTPAAEYLLRRSNPEAPPAPSRQRARIDLGELRAELAPERSAGLDALVSQPAAATPAAPRDPAAPPVAIADIESPEDRFRCAPYRAVLVARACVARQLSAEAAAWAPGSNSAALAARKMGGGFVGCAACADGRAVANRLLAIAETKGRKP